MSKFANEIMNLSLEIIMKKFFILFILNFVLLNVYGGILTSGFIIEHYTQLKIHNVKIDIYDVDTKKVIDKCDALDIELFRHKGELPHTISCEQFGWKINTDDLNFGEFQYEEKDEIVSYRFIFKNKEGEIVVFSLSFQLNGNGSLFCDLAIRPGDGRLYSMVPSTTYIKEKIEDEIKWMPFGKCAGCKWYENDVIMLLRKILGPYCSETMIWTDHDQNGQTEWVKLFRKETSELIKNFMKK